MLAAGGSKIDEKILQLNYDMTLEEVSKGFKLFQKKYLLKRCLIYTAVYVIALVLAIDMVVKNPANFYGYLVLGLAAGLLVHTWVNPVRVRKKLIQTLSGLYEEKYISVFYNDRIEITTEIFTPIVVEAENEENTDETAEDAVIKTENAEIKQENEPETEKSVWQFGVDLIEALEDDEMFLLFVRKSLIYVYPKRCLDEEQQEKLRQIIEEKAL